MKVRGERLRKRRNQGVENAVDVCTKHGSRLRGETESRVIGRQQRGVGGGRMLPQQSFECCHKTVLHYKVVCASLCTYVIIPLCQQQESKVCVCV